MFDFIPINQYSSIFYYTVLVMTLLVFFQCQRGNVFRKDVVNLNAGFGFLLAFLLIFYMGQRPLSAEFGDTMNYVVGYQKMANTPFKWSWDNDFLFYNLMHWFSHIYSIHEFFTFCSFLYVFLIWLAMQRIFKSYYFIPFLVVLCMFTFWEYGVNGVRSGIASSFFILALSYINNIPVTIFLCFLSIGFHKSMMLIVAAAILTWFVENSYYYLAFWLGVIPISFIMGDRIQSYVAGLNILGEGEERLSQYLTYTHEQMISDGLIVNMSFRWDFILYSALGVAVGYYFIFRRNFKDEYYHWIYNTFLLANAIWILIIRAAYSNRFAQISWFIMPIVLIYPFMKKRFWINHEKMLGYAILAFYAFAFYQNILK